MGATVESLLADLETLGFLSEALCVRDLKVYAEALDAKVYHYQDYSENEIDAVIEMRNGSWAACEIKLGANHQKFCASYVAFPMHRISALMESMLSQ